MKKISWFVLCIGLSLSLCAESKLNYHFGDLKSAKEQAKKENKMVFLKFYADWCVPCKWMDETTLNDAVIVDKINSNFIPLKVNIDDFDGFALRQKLAVSVLPTIVIYDSEGMMIKRIEETLSTSNLNNSLDELISKNGQRIVHNINQAPTNVLSDPPKPKKVSNVQKKSFKLQLGVFVGFENTMNYLDAIKDKVDDQAMVLHDYRDGHTMYKVLIGRYNSHEEAAYARDRLRSSHGIDSIVY